MPIAGLTDKQESFSALGRLGYGVFKGTRKVKGKKRNAQGEEYEYEGYGEDLQTRLRITVNNPALSPILRQHYGQPDESGDFLTQQVRIYLPFDEVERTFSTAMRGYRASGIEVVCDRRRISQQMQMVEDNFGKHRKLAPCDKPCPMAGQPLSMKCEYQCVAEGQLFFYIKEVLDANCMVAGRITLHSYEDIEYIDTTLRQYKEALGSITNSPFPIPQFRHKIPFILSRVRVPIKRPVMEKKKRTGKSSDSFTWAVDLQIDPTYMHLHAAWQEVQERVKWQLPVSKITVAGLLRGDTSAMQVIDAEVVDIPASRPLLPGFEVSEVWKQWKSPREAIAWAIGELPGWTPEQVQTEFDNLQPVNGKKAPAWVFHVKRLAEDKVIPQ